MKWDITEKLLWSLVALVTVGLTLIVIDIAASLSGDDQREYNFLSNSLRDLEAPTNANILLREIECSEWQKKAERYLKIPRSDVAEKVLRYVGYCKGVKTP